MGKLKGLFIYPNLQMVTLLPSNIAILLAHLKKRDIDVRLFDTTLYKTSKKSVDDIRVEHMQLRPFNLGQKGVRDGLMRTFPLYAEFEESVWTEIEKIERFEPGSEETLTKFSEVYR